MGKGVSTHPFGASKMGNTSRLKRSWSTLSLMPWERRHQHTMKDFLRNVHNQGRALQEVPQQSLAPATQNLHGPENVTDKPGKSSPVVDEVARYFSDKGRKEIDTPKKNGDCCIGNVINLRQKKMSVELSPDLKNIEFSSKSVAHFEVSASMDLKLPAQKSYSIPQNNTQCLILTNNQTPQLQIQPLKERVDNTDHCPSHVQVLVNSNGLQIQKDCHHNLRFQAIDREARKIPHTRQNTGALNKNFKYAVKYNLDQIFTCVFPQVKKPLRQRLMYF